MSSAKTKTNRSITIKLTVPTDSRSLYIIGVGAAAVVLFGVGLWLQSYGLWQLLLMNLLVTGFGALVMWYLLHARTGVRVAGIVTVATAVLLLICAPYLGRFAYGWATRQLVKAQGTVMMAKIVGCDYHGSRAYLGQNQADIEQRAQATKISVQIENGRTASFLVGDSTPFPTDYDYQLCGGPRDANDLIEGAPLWGNEIRVRVWGWLVRPEAEFSGCSTTDKHTISYDCPNLYGWR